MPKFAANLSMMFNEVPFLDRFGAAAAAGFGAVEYLFPFDYPAEEIARRLRDHGLENVLFNLAPGNWANGERGLTSLPGRQQEFRESVDQALSYASALGVARLHAMAGIPPRDADPESVKAAYLGNLEYAADRLAPHGITLLMEAINTRDMPGFYLNTQAQADAIRSAVNRPNLKLQLDLYHMQIMEGDLETRLRRYLSVCGHIQVASVPRRNEPDSGEVNYAYLFALIDRLGYDGWIGCEYRPAGETTAGLGWLQAARGTQPQVHS